MTESPRFESYYKVSSARAVVHFEGRGSSLAVFSTRQAQKIVPEEEWDAFNAALHEPLPTTFRITGCRE